jgi:hypothetical protein
MFPVIDDTLFQYYNAKNVKINPDYLFVMKLKKENCKEAVETGLTFHTLEVDMVFSAEVILHMRLFHVHQLG